jgi:hypothetical protein
VLYGGGANFQVLARRKIQNSGEAERRQNQEKSNIACHLSNHSPQAKLKLQFSWAWLGKQMDAYES